MSRPDTEVSPERIADLFRENFGRDRVLTEVGDRFRVADEEVRVVAFPGHTEELGEMLRLAAQERLRVIPAGAGAWLEMGNRPPLAHLIISTARMNRVLEYEPADLTATVEAGCPLAAFNAQAAAHRQFIPLDHFGGADATIGAVVATASSGPLRCGYGTPRDWVIGMRVAHADGHLTKAGGKVVKNVAGYDLCKLYTGSFGTLGVIGELSFKLRALPPGERTLVFYADAPGELCALAARVADSDVQPAALELISAPPAPGAPGGEAVRGVADGRHALALRFLGEEETIASQIAEAVRLGAGLRGRGLGEGEAADFWDAYRASEIAPEWGYNLRLSTLPADLGAMIAEVGRLLPRAGWRAHAGSGVLRVLAGGDLLDDLKAKQRPQRIAELRHAAQSRGGQLVIWRAPAELKAQLDVWGEVGPAAPLMRALKEKFDPHGQLNPGRFAAGI